jgi:ketosteroid isomerase-like protein
VSGTVSTLDSVPAPVTKLLDAANAHDTGAFLDIFVDGAVVDDWGREFVGTDAIRRWSDREFIGKHVTLKIGAIRQQGDLTVVTAQVGGDGFNGPSNFSFLIDGDLVSRMTIRA